MSMVENRGQPVDACVDIYEEKNPKKWHEFVLDKSNRIAEEKGLKVRFSKSTPIETLVGFYRANLRNGVKIRHRPNADDASVRPKNSVVDVSVQQDAGYLPGEVSLPKDGKGGTTPPKMFAQTHLSSHSS